MAIGPCAFKVAWAGCFWFKCPLTGNWEVGETFQQFWLFDCVAETSQPWLMSKTADKSFLLIYLVSKRWSTQPAHSNSRIYKSMQLPASSPNSKPIKVLHILNELRFSGAETMLASASGHFASEEIDSTILSTGNEIGPFAEELRTLGYKIAHIPFSKSISFYVRVRAFIKSGRFDVLHIHCERANPVYALAAFGLCRTVRTVHHLFTFEGALRYRKILERRFCRLLGVVDINNSESGLQNERIRFYAGGVLAENWFNDSYYRPPTIPERQSARRSLNINPEDFLIISLGSNVEYKNYPAILDAVEALQQTIPNLYYVHAGDEGQGKPLSEKARKLGIERRTILPGRVPEPLQFLWAADCYVMPSFEEGFGIAAIEAIATQLPCILANRPALSDFANHFSGIAFVEPTSSGVAGGIRHFVDMTAEERAIVVCDYNQKAVHQFGVKAGAGRYLDVYFHLLRSSSKSAARSNLA